MSELASHECKDGATLEECLGKLTHSLHEHTEARLAGIEAKLDMLLTFVNMVEEMAGQLAANPMLAGMLGGNGIDFGV